jgi:hypothetical protein
MIPGEIAEAQRLARERKRRSPPHDPARHQTEKAIEAFASLAERLDALATEREQRQWWRRLVGMSGGF